TFVDTTRNYIEPFAGSAALFFALKPTRATLADLNGHLINAMRQVRDDPARVFTSLRQMDRSERTYYRVRSAFNKAAPFGLKSAVQFIYLNRNCFNGL